MWPFLILMADFEPRGNNKMKCENNHKRKFPSKYESFVNFKHLMNLVKYEFFFSYLILWQNLVKFQHFNSPYILLVSSSLTLLASFVWRFAFILKRRAISQVYCIIHSPDWWMWWVLLVCFALCTTNSDCNMSA